MKFLFLFFISISCSAQELLHLSTASLVCGVAESAFNSEKRINLNPAAMMNATSCLLSTSVVSNYFLMEFSTANLSASFKSGEKTRLNIGLARVGDKTFKKQGANISIAKKLSKSFAVGISLRANFFHYNDERYKNLSSLTPTAFTHIDLSRRLSAGMIIHNPTKSKISNSEFPEPSWISSSLCYKSGKAQIGAGIELVNHQSGNFNIGIESEPVPNFLIRLGFQTSPQSISFGSGLVWHNVLIDAGCRIQTFAGTTTALTLTVPVK